MHLGHERGVKEWTAQIEHGQSAKESSRNIFMRRWHLKSTLKNALNFEIKMEVGWGYSLISKVKKLSLREQKRLVPGPSISRCGVRT